MLADHISRNAFDIRLKKASFDEYLHSITGMSPQRNLQELDGDVAGVWNTAVATGRDLNAGGMVSTTWIGLNNPTLSNPIAGELSVAYIDTSNPIASKSIIAIGKTFLIEGEAQGDGGSAVPEIRGDNAAEDNLWVGTSVATWQPFSVPFTSTASVSIWLLSQATAGGEFCKWRNVTIKQTGILGSSSYPGGELYVTPNAASDPAGNEANATTGWANTGSATLTSDSAVKSAGDYSIKTVISGAGHSISFDLDAILTVGIRYKLILDSRHLGSGGDMQVNLASTPSTSEITLFALTNTDTTFETVPIEFTHSAATRYINARENSGTNDGGAYIDNISIRPANPLNWDNTGLAVGQTTHAAGNVHYLYSGDGVAARLTPSVIAEYNSIINMANGGKTIVAQSDTWAAGVDVLWRSAVDANDEIVIYRSGTDLVVEYHEGGNSNTVTIPSGSPTGLFTIGAGWDVAGAGLTGFYNGVQSGAAVAISAAIIGNLDIDETALFASNSAGANSWAGDGAYAALYTRTATAADHLDYHIRSGI